ncbi:hypothetical protein KR009_010593, partial [Drosophila setifemur]
SPSVFYILFWHLAVHMLYPYGYMDCTMQDALGNDHLVWCKGDRLEEQLVQVVRDSFRTTLMLVMLTEMMRSLDAALNLPVALVGRV